MRINRRRIFVLLFSITLLFGCSSIKISTQQDYWPTEQWRYLTPEEQGMDGKLIETLLKRASIYDIHNILVIRNGYVVAEYSKHPYSIDFIQPINSITKSITATLIGIAIDQGYIESVDQSITDFFPEILEDESIDKKYAEVTIKHLLTMTPGMDWPEHGEWDGELWDFQYSGKWLSFIFSRDIIETPGEIFNYNTGASHLLSAIIHRTTQMDTKSFAEEYLFHPLGITSIVWKKDSDGIYAGGYQLKLKPEDLAKLGLLYLNDGVWDDKQLISKEWLEEMFSPHIEHHYDIRYGRGKHYGYQWWIQTSDKDKKSKKILIAAGGTSERLYIVPDDNLVVVFTGDLPNSLSIIPYQLTTQYIYSAIKK